MRGKRSKQYRKLMAQYEMTFGFRGPYQVLSPFASLSSRCSVAELLPTVDAQIIQDTERLKMDLVGGLERTLSGKVKPSIIPASAFMRIRLMI